MGDLLHVLPWSKRHVTDFLSVLNPSDPVEDRIGVGVRYGAGTVQARSAAGSKRATGFLEEGNITIKIVGKQLD